MNNDLDTLLAQLRQRLIDQSSAPAQKTMEEIQVTGQRSQDQAQQDPLRLFLQQPQAQSMGGLTGMPVPGLGPQSYNPMFKEGMVKEPSIKELGAMMGK